MIIRTQTSFSIFSFFLIFHKKKFDCENFVTRQKKRLRRFELYLLIFTMLTPFSKSPRKMVVQNDNWSPNRAFRFSDFSDSLHTKKSFLTKKFLLLYYKRKSKSPIKNFMRWNWNQWFLNIDKNFNYVTWICIFLDKIDQICFSLIYQKKTKWKERCLVVNNLVFKK